VSRGWQSSQAMRRCAMGMPPPENMRALRTQSLFPYIYCEVSYSIIQPIKNQNYEKVFGNAGLVHRGRRGNNDVTWSHCRIYRKIFVEPLVGQLLLPWRCVCGVGYFSFPRGHDLPKLRQKRVMQQKCRERRSAGTYSIGSHSLKKMPCKHLCKIPGPYRLTASALHF
jgi:hypothetical protein